MYDPDATGARQSRVATTTIRQQTVEALKNPLHPYRQALDETFGGRVLVFDIGDFAQITPHARALHDRMIA